ncbi:MAG: hypothetical protein INF18_04990 [Methylobacterium sp.]|nr:hypothetical protein [Methylobacterium sp.]MCA3637806.1 hypothetical protein [Methylobacterium sp.]
MTRIPDLSRIDARAAWRRAVLSAYPEGRRPARLGWLLSELALKGFAYASDAYLAAESGVPFKHVNAVLVDMERQGLIRREIGPRPDGSMGRRIVPTLPAASPSVGDCDPLREGKEIPCGRGAKVEEKDEPRRRSRAVADIGTVADASRAVGWAVSDIKAAALAGDAEALAKAAERLRALYHEDEPTAAGGGGL